MVCQLEDWQPGTMALLRCYQFAELESGAITGKKYSILFT